MRGDSRRQPFWKRELKEIVEAIAITLICVLTFLGLLYVRGVAYGAERINEYQAIIDTATEEDLYALECVIYWESAVADCDYTVNKAVAETVFNRALNRKQSIEKICKARGQFVCKPIPDNTSLETWEDISDAIEGLVNYGREILPSTEYEFFATKKQSLGKDHVWVGEMKDGKVVKGKGMYFCQEK